MSQFGATSKLLPGSAAALSLAAPTLSRVLDSYM